MRFLGVDQSLTGTGLVVVQDGVVDHVEVVSTKLSGYQRVDHIVGRVVEVAASVDVVAVEAPTLSVRGSASTGALFGLFGVLTHDLWRQGKEPVVVNPNHRSMYAVGRGGVKKDEVFAAVVRRYQDDRVVDNNAADALLLAAMVARMAGEPVLVEGDLPTSCVSVLARVGSSTVLDRLIPAALAADREWMSVVARVGGSRADVLKSLPGASPTYAHALLDYASSRGMEVWPNQGNVSCVRRLVSPTHTCGGVKCHTEWATPDVWQFPVLLRQTAGERRWAILHQELPDDHCSGMTAPVGGGRVAVLETGL